MQISWTIEGDKQLSRKLIGMSTSVKDFHRPLQKSATMLLGIFSGPVFATEGAIIGEKWQRLSPYTVAQKARSGYGNKGILEASGRMKRSFRAIVSSEQAVLHNEADYFKYHQSNKPRRHLPRRVMMKLNQSSKEMIVKYFQQYIREIATT